MLRGRGITIGSGGKICRIIWMGDIVGGKECLMVIELQFKSIIVPLADLQEKYPHLISALEQYLPVQRPVKRRRPRKQKQTVGHLIDALIDSIESGGSG